MAEAPLAERNRVAGICRAFEAADLFRCFSAFTGLTQLNDLVSQFKLTNIVTGCSATSVSGGGSTDTDLVL